MPVIELDGADSCLLTSNVLLNNSNTLWDVGASVLATIFEGGRLRGQVRVPDARRARAIANYEKTVLTDFGEVEDQLAAVTDLA